MKQRSKQQTRWSRASGIDNGRLLRGLELEFEVELKTASGISGRGLAEIGIARAAVGTDDADVGHVVDMIEDVEGVQSDGENGTVFLFLLETEVVLDVEIEIDEAGAVESIARLSLIHI